MTKPLPGPVDPKVGAAELHATCRHWVDHIPQNLPYVDLMFAFGFATCGDHARARSCVEAARKAMVVPIPTKWDNPAAFVTTTSAVTTSFLFGAFENRIEQAVAGKPHFGPLSANLATEREEIANKSRGARAHNPYLRAEYIIDRLRQYSQILEPQERVDPTHLVVSHCLRSLKKLGVQSAIDDFLARLHIQVLGGRTSEELREQYAANPEIWSAVFQTRLNLSGVWLTSRLAAQPEPIFDEARNELLSPSAVKLPPKDYTKLAQAYVTALGADPPEIGLPRLAEFFREMPRDMILNTWTTREYFSRFHLNLIEDTVFAVCRMASDYPTWFSADAAECG